MKFHITSDHPCVKGGPAGITYAECGCKKCLKILEQERDFMERHNLRTLEDPKDPMADWDPWGIDVD